MFLFTSKVAEKLKMCSHVCVYRTYFLSAFLGYSSLAPTSICLFRRTAAAVTNNNINKLYYHTPDLVGCIAR